MSKIKLKWLQMRLFKKINVIHVALTIAAMLILFFIQYSYLMPIINDYEKLLEKSSFDDLSDYMEEVYVSVIGTVESMYSNKRMMSAMRSANESGENWFDYGTGLLMDEFCTSAFRSNNSIMDIIFISNNDDVFFKSKNANRTISSNYGFSTDDILLDVRERSRKQGFYYGNNLKYILNEKEQAISFAGIISDIEFLQSGEVLGVFIFNISFANIEKSMAKNIEYLKGTLSVSNLDDIIIYSTNPEFAGINSPGISEIDLSNKSGISLEGENIVQSKLLRKPEVRVINSMQSHILQKNLNTLTLSMLGVLMAIIIVFSLLIFLISKVYNERLAVMMGQMRQVQKGNFQVRIPEEPRDEIGELGVIFNEMCQKLEKHIQLVYEAEIEQRDFEIMALQSQINPHFLFNTLESIRMKALVEGQYDLEQMVAALGNLFRRSVKTTSKIINIEDEMEYVESYLELMQFRFEETLSFSIQNDREILPYGIPKLSLQPIIENAISHGIQGAEDGRIEIRGRMCDDKIIITVSDNGAGVSAEGLEQLREQMYSVQTLQEQGNFYKIGLRNVHRRIIMLFGEEFGLEVDSSPGKGTQVTITIPLLEKEKFQNV